MLASSIPSKIELPFATSGTKNTIPVASQISITPGAASFTDGFPPLTFTPVASGGIPPFGADFNGVFNQITAIQQWQSAGGVFKYDSTFSTAIGGYPAGAILESTDGHTQWLNLADNNTADPDGATPTNWAPLASYGITAITGVTNANVTLTPAQYSRSVITLSGTLTGNIQIIFPTTQQKWLVVNNTTGAFTVTCKTAAGTGAIIPQAGGLQEFYGDGTNLVPSVGDVRYSQLQQIQPVSASVATNALTVSLGATLLAFRSTTLTTGTASYVNSPSSISLVVPSGATLGTVNNVQARLVLLAINNAGSMELAIVNLAGGNTLDETTLISTTAISTAATAANVIYSTTARTNVAFRIVGFIDITEATAGAWATAPTLVQGVGGQALAAMGSLGFGQTWQNVAGSRAPGVTYYNTKGKPIIVVARFTSNVTADAYISVTQNGVSVTITGSSGVSGSGIFADAIIPPGAAYLASCGGTPTLVGWQEFS